MAKKKAGRPPSGKPTMADGRLADKFMVRLPLDLKAPLEAAAKEGERTVTQEVAFRLRQSLKKGG